MCSLKAFIIFGAVVVAAVSARPQGQQQSSGFGGQQAGAGGLPPPPPPFGPLGAVVDKLTDAQRESLKEIFSDQSLTKAQIKQKLDNFVSGLSSDLQVRLRCPGLESLMLTEYRYPYNLHSLGQSEAGEGAVRKEQAIHPRQPQRCR